MPDMKVPDLRRPSRFRVTVDIICREPVPRRTIEHKLLSTFLRALQDDGTVDSFDFHVDESFVLKRVPTVHKIDGIDG